MHRRFKMFVGSWSKINWTKFFENFGILIVRGDMWCLIVIWLQFEFVIFHVFFIRFWFSFSFVWCQQPVRHLFILKVRNVGRAHNIKYLRLTLFPDDHFTFIVQCSKSKRFPFGGCFEVCPIKRFQCSAHSLFDQHLSLTCNFVVVYDKPSGQAWQIFAGFSRRFGHRNSLSALNSKTWHRIKATHKYFRSLA